MPAILDITGQKFGRLTALKRLGQRKANRISIWLCRCSCGNETTVNLSHLRNGNTRSCGCLRFGNAGNTSHGKWGTPEYNSWAGMLQRCYDPNATNYKYYGGRGIGVCKRWRHSFENFLADMGLKPAPKLTLERINNNAWYSPKNCKWATHSEQMQNKRR